MFPILLKLGPLTIRTYGVLIAIGLFVALRYISVQGRRENISEDSIMDMGLYIIVAGLLGARAAYVAQNWQYYSSNITAIFKIWEGGLVFYGGFIAGLVAALIYLRAHREINLWVFGDIIAPALALAQSFGRIGCFFAGCCYGSACALPWAVTFKNAQSLAPLNVALHPVQLYESAGCFLIFIFLDWYNRHRHKTGFALGAYLVFYALLRFHLEFLRSDDRGGAWIGLSPSQIISLFALVSGALILVLKNHAKTQLNNTNNNCR
jgi:phosphatidylglycerol:prolipoprotein diacylglycerol transferase